MFLELFDEAADIVIPDLGGDRRNVKVFAHKFLGRIHPYVSQEFFGTHPHTLLEGPAKMIFAQIHLFGNGLKSQFIGKVLLYIINHKTQICLLSLSFLPAIGSFTQVA